MAKMTPLLLRLEPELVARIDEARGDVARALFIRKRLGELFAPSVVRARRYGEPNAKALAAAAEGPPGGIMPYDPKTGDPIYPKPALTMKDIRGDFVPRLKPDKGAKR
jgi:hypothetical protein